MVLMNTAWLPVFWQLTVLWHRILILSFALSFNLLASLIEFTRIELEAGETRKCH